MRIPRMQGNNQSSSEQGHNPSWLKPLKLFTGQILCQRRRSSRQHQARPNGPQTAGASRGLKRFARACCQSMLTRRRRMAAASWHWATPRWLQAPRAGGHLQKLPRRLQAFPKFHGRGRGRPSLGRHNTVRLARRQRWLRDGVQPGRLSRCLRKLTLRAQSLNCTSL